MVSTQYEKGRRIEYKIADYFRDEVGCTVVRSAGSHGPWDLVAVGEHGIFLIQVKSYEGNTQPRYREAEASLKAVITPRECNHIHKLIAIYKKGKGLETLVRIE